MGEGRCSVLPPEGPLSPVPGGLAPISPMLVAWVSMLTEATTVSPVAYCSPLIVMSRTHDYELCLFFGVLVFFLCGVCVFCVIFCVFLLFLFLYMN